MSEFTKSILVLFVFFFTTFIAILLPKTINASIIITEVYPNPVDDEHEWIEIYNDSSTETTIPDSWIIMDELSSPSIIYQFDQISIEPLSFEIIELNTNKLNNSGDSVKLIDSNNNTISQFSYTNSEPAMSFSLILDSNNNSSIIISEPTKGLINFVNIDENNNDPTCEENDTDCNNNSSNEDENSEQNEENNNTTDQSNNQTYLNLIISDLMACPETDNSEWVEIKNPNSVAISLDNWAAKDEADNKISLPSGILIPELGSTQIQINSSILNNSGDSIFLFNPNGELIDQITYNECIVGVSIKNADSISDQNTANDRENNNDENVENGTINTSTNNFSQKDTEKQIKIDTDQKNGLNDPNKIRISQFKKINSILNITNPDKSSSKEINNYLSKQIIIKHRSLQKYPVISVIIGGVIISGLGLFNYLPIPIKNKYIEPK